MTTDELCVYEYLENKGINVALNGFSYLVTAILYVAEHPSATRNDFCKYTAKHHNTSFYRVDAAMDYALRDYDCTTKKFVRSAAAELCRKNTVGNQRGGVSHV